MERQHDQWPRLSDSVWIIDGHCLSEVHHLLAQPQSLATDKTECINNTKDFPSFHPAFLISRRWRWPWAFTHAYCIGIYLWTGDVLIQISETQRRLTVEMDGVVSISSHSGQIYMLKLITAIECMDKWEVRPNMSGCNTQYITQWVGDRCFLYSATV